MTWPQPHSRAGVVADFDGTLARIVEDPATSSMVEGAGPALAALAQVLPLVAVVSGRPAAFLAARAAVPGVRLLGLYGLEEVRDGEVVVRPDAARWQGAVDEARELLAAALPQLPRGVAVEDKGLAVAVHWRRAHDPAAAEARVAAVVADVAARTGLRRDPGKLVEELRPPVERDKGDAVRDLAQETGLDDVAYIGDDLGDLPAFAVARALGGLAVAVDHGPETPAPVLAAADVVVRGAEGVAVWLEELAARVGVPPGGAPASA